MKVRKNIKALLMTSLILFSLSNISHADNNTDNKFSESAKLLEIKAWSETKEDGESFSTTNLKSDNFQKIKDAKATLGENIILHNNGKPIETNMFEKKDGNELFAITVNNIYGIEQKSYYFMQNIDKVEMNDLMESINEGEQENTKSIQARFDNKNTKSTISPDYIENFKWDFFATGYDGVKRQQGSLATSLGFDKKSSNVVIDGVKGSVWDVASFSQMLSRSNGALLDHRTRLDVNYSNQQLYSWGPFTTGASSATVSLRQLVSPVDWSFPLNGFRTDDLSSKSGKYGRWQFKPNLIVPNKMITDPGIRVTNTKGNLGLKLSHTAEIKTPYARSNHSTGVILNSIPDR